MHKHKVALLCDPKWFHSPETKDNSVAILLSYGTVRLLLAGYAEAKEEFMASGSYTRPRMLINVPKLHTV